VALGATHHRWRPDIEREVHKVLRRFSTLSANTYEGHPWPGWDRFSADFWGPAGRGDPIGVDLSWSSARFLLRLPGRPLIRHLIVEHSLWTSWGGWSYWTPADHTGDLRHVHVTFWPHGEWSVP
jgi:hypothetical protein